MRGTITLEDAVKDQVILVDAVNNLDRSTKPRKENKKEEKSLTDHNINMT